jgi:hypothetical protein
LYKGLTPPKDPVEQDSFTSKGTILSSVNTNSLGKWKIPPKESPVPVIWAKKKRKKKKNPHFRKGWFLSKNHKEPVVLCIVLSLLENHGYYAGRASFAGVL